MKEGFFFVNGEKVVEREKEPREVNKKVERGDERQLAQDANYRGKHHFFGGGGLLLNLIIINNGAIQQMWYLKLFSEKHKYRAG